jgi:hypothetical protein
MVRSGFADDPTATAGFEHDAEILVQFSFRLSATPSPTTLRWARTTVHCASQLLSLLGIHPRFSMTFRNCTTISWFQSFHARNHKLDPHFQMPVPQPWVSVENGEMEPDSHVSEVMSRQRIFGNIVPRSISQGLRTPSLFGV